MCGEAVTGLDRQGRGRLWVCLDGAAEGAFCTLQCMGEAEDSHFCYFLNTAFCLDYRYWVSVGLFVFVHVLSTVKLVKLFVARCARGPTTKLQYILYVSQ